MTRALIAVIALGLALNAQRGVAHACGGFFCSAQPVDQTAERIVFRVREDSTTMVVQIAYSGPPSDFAWVLPLGQLPDVASLSVFPQRALSMLDTLTGPQWQPPEACPGIGSCPVCSGVGPQGVTVHFGAEVGPYEVAGIESDDPDALFTWLRDNGFNVGEAMRPYIAAYVREGMKFLAAKLKAGADSSEIQPLKLELPGTTPSIPLRMTALAAEPEMGLLVFVFGDQRYGGANWPDVEIPSERILWSLTSFQLRTNYLALAARGVDEAGGQGWITEYADSTEVLLERLVVNPAAPNDIQEAANAMRELIGDAPFVTRLYARLSAEEMRDDPLFRRVAGGLVPRTRQLPSQVDDLKLCDEPTLDPCALTSCGAGGVCRPVKLEGMDEPVAACACVDGASARTVLDAARPRLTSGGAMTFAPAIACVDERMSFVNPGDMTSAGVVMVDPCAGFDCGPDGECLAVNMTPTCRCDRGFVAVGSVREEDGARGTRCERPSVEVPESFYGLRLPDLPAELPGGRKTTMPVDPEMPVVQPMMEDLGSGSVPVGRPQTPPVGEGKAGSAAPENPSGAGGQGDMPGRETRTDSSDGCAAVAAGAGGPLDRLELALFMLCAVAWARRRRR